LSPRRAPIFDERPLDHAALAPICEVIDLALSGNDPNPTTVIDRRWNLVDAHAATFWLCADVAPHLLADDINVARVMLHPDGLADRIENFAGFTAQFLAHMSHTLAATHDSGLASLIEECASYAPDLAAEATGTVRGDEIVLPMRIDVDGVVLSFLSTITTFGAARDVTVADLSIETLYPADAATRTLMRSRPWA